MNDDRPGFLTALERAAHQAQSAEVAFRDGIAREIATRERARQFAFRRLGIASDMVRAARGAEDAAAAVEAQCAALMAELGWSNRAGTRTAVMDAWENVARAVATSVGLACEPPHDGDVEAAFAGFEAWYETQHGVAFLSLLDQEMPEMPVVEF